MIRIILALSLTVLASCYKQDTEGSRSVVTLTSDAGQSFHFMPIYEDGVTDITVRIAWPTNWARSVGRNPAVPYVGSELILSGGTADLKPQDVMEMFNTNNAGGFLLASPDFVFGELGFPKEHIDETVQIAAEMLSNPQLDDPWLDRIKQDFLQGQIELQAVSANKMWSAARVAVLGQTPLSRSLDLPDLDAITALTREDILAWHAETFTKTGVMVVVTGAISEEDAGQVVDDLLASLPEGAPKLQPQDAADFSQKTILLHLPSAEKTTLGLLGRLPPTTEDGYIEDLLAVQLLNGANSPLFDAIRTELRATYGLQSGYTNYTRALRPFFIFGEVETSRLAEVRDVALEAYETFRKSPDLTGLNELRSRVVEGTKENISYVNVSAQVIMELALDGKDVTQAPDLHKGYEDITSDALTVRLATMFPPASSLIVLAVSPDENALPGACVISEIGDAINC